jgi:tetratricopeptide (TPR) repeat protein
MRFKHVIASVCLCAILGCAGASKSQRREDRVAANKRWNSTRAAVLGQLASDQYKSGNFDKSRQTLNEAMRMDPENGRLHLLSAKLAIEQGQLELADKELGAARRGDPKNAEVEYFSGVVYQRWEQPEKALEFYQVACEKAPTELAYLMAEAETLVSMDRASEALDLLKQKVVFFEHSAVIRDAAGQLLVREQRWPEAVDMLRQATVLAEDDVTVREHYALALYFNKQYREAADTLTRLLTNEKCAKRGDLYLALGECQLELGRPRAAWPALETATQLSPNSTEAWISLAKVAMKLNDLRRADLSLRHAVSLNPASTEAHLLAGYVYVRQNRLSDALNSFRKATALDPGDVVSLCMTGYVLQKSGRPDQAMKFYARALKLKPGDEMATKLMASVNLSE